MGTNGAQLAARDDGGCSGYYQSKLRQALPAGEHWVVVDGFSASSGSYACDRPN